MSKYMLYFVVFVIIIVNGGSGLSGWLTTLLQCFDTVGWVVRLRPVKTVGRITYIVSVQTLNHAQSINQWC